MSEDIETGELNRLEDFVALAKGGEKVRVEIELRKKLIKEKVHPDETDDMSDEMDMYLLMADYMIGAQGVIKTISKIYVMGSVSESLVAASGNKNIANQRLKMDYQRFRDANITFVEKYY